MKEEKQSTKKEKRLVHASFSADSVPLIWLPNEWDGKTHSIVK